MKSFLPKPQRHGICCGRVLACRPVRMCCFAKFGANFQESTSDVHCNSYPGAQVAPILTKKHTDVYYNPHPREEPFRRSGPLNKIPNMEDRVVFGHVWWILGKSPKTTVRPRSGLN